MRSSPAFLLSKRLLSSAQTSGWLVVCGGALFAALGGACAVDVQLGFPDGSCDFDGAELANGETALEPDGCNSCACKDGTLACTMLDCNPCPEAEQPTCTDMPADTGCYAAPECGPGGWECIYDCPCAELVPDCPPPLPGCYYEGPFCDGAQWFCGTLICPTCDQEILCDPPVDPLCYIEPICNDQLVWECHEVCPPQCPEPKPSCGGASFAACSDKGWVCEGNATCGPELIECQPSPYPYCQTYMECSPNGWGCQETCDPAYCPDKAPICDPLGPPNCSAYPTCSSQGWLCVETCV